MNDERDEIRRRIDIVDLVSQRVQLKRSGKNYTGLCPFHDDKSPSFLVSPHLGSYRCWSCGEKGDVFTWVMKTQGLDFREALKLLADQAGVQLAQYTGPKVDKSEREKWLATMQSALIFFRNELGKSAKAKAYCDNRDLPQAVIDEWELGYSPEVREAMVTHLKRDGHVLAEAEKLFLVQGDQQIGYAAKFFGRLMFPIRDDRGDLVGFGGRVIGDGNPKYINSSDTPLYRKSRVLYGFHKARDRMMKDRHAVLVEGYLDVIACHRAGVTEAVASLGTALAEDHAKLLKRYCDRVTILYDADSAGQKAAVRAVEILEATGLACRVALMPQGEDPDTLLRTKGADAVRDAVGRAESPFDFQIRLLEAQHGVEADRFWQELPVMLAKAPSELDLEKHLLRLAGQHPSIPNAQAATKALRREVAKHRRTQKSGGPSDPISLPSKAGVGLLRAEQIIFAAWLHEEGRTLVRDILEKPEMWQSAAARSLIGGLKGKESFHDLGEEHQALMMEIDTLVSESERSPAEIQSVLTLFEISWIEREIKSLEEQMKANPSLIDLVSQRKDLINRLNDLKAIRSRRQP